MGKSIFDGLLSFRTQLFSSLRKQNDALKVLSAMSLADVSDDFNVFVQSALNQTITSHNNETITIIKEENANQISIQLDKLNSLGENMSKQFTKIVESTSDIELSDYIDVDLDFNMKWSDVLTSLKEGIDMNEFYSTINDLWMKNTNVDSSTVNGIIQSFRDKASSGLFKGDLTSIRTTLLSASSSGKISNSTWLSYLNNLVDDSHKNVTTEKSLIATSENPFSVTTFFMTVLNIITTGFSYILAAIGAIFSGLFGIIGAILSGIWNGLKSLLHADWDINPTASYPGIYGTYVAGTSDKPLDNYNSCDNISDMDVSKIYRKEFPGLDCYLYRFDVSNGTSKIICQYQPVLNVRYQDLHTIVDQDIEVVNVDPITGIGDVQGLLTAREHLLSMPLMSDAEFYTQFQSVDNYRRNVYASLAATLFFCCDEDVVHDQSSTSALRYVVEKLKQSAQNVSISNSNVKDLYGWLLEAFPKFFGWDSYLVSTFDIYMRDPMSIFFEDGAQVNHSHLTDEFFTLEDTGFIPTDDCVKVPDIDMGAFILSVLFIGGLSLAAVYGAKKFSAWMQSRKQLRQTKRIQDLSDARKAYMDNPDNDELRKDYMKQLKKYNFKAKLFGWAEYDAGNAWLNEPTDSNGDNGLSTSDVLVPFYTNKLAKMINASETIVPES